MLTLLSSATVLASPRFPDDRLPPIDAPASAYGSDVRPGPQGRPNADDLAGIAERQRQQGHPALALQLAQRVLAFAPDHSQARRTQISSLSNLGAFAHAEALRQRHAPAWPEATQARFHADATAGAIRLAIHEQAYRERRARYATRDVDLKASLRALEADMATYAPESDARRRARVDRLIVLRQLRRFDAVIAESAALTAQGGEIAIYAQPAVADAYLARRQPQQAATRYREAISANPSATLATRTGYYYALIESERYDQAADVLARLERETPTWRYRQDATMPPVPNWERSEVDRLSVLDATYRRHEARALSQARALYRHAPRNVDVINLLATAQRSRGWYDAAEGTAELAAAYAPQDKSTRLALAEISQDREAFDRWEAMIEPLAVQFQSDSAVERNWQEWQDRNRFSLEGEATLGRSHGGGAVNGSRDREYRLRLNAPWREGGYRLFAEQRYRWSDFEAGDEHRTRQALGIERQWRRHHWWAALSGEALSDDIGVDLGWSDWLGDHWQYRLLTQTQSVDTPLRAERAGLDGQRYEGQLTWRANESRQATLTLGALDISDGNLRRNVGADLTQRLQASAHHQTRLIGSLAAEHNSEAEAAYYSPEDTRSAGISLEHDWMTWRHYDQSLTQNVTLGAASEWERGYGADTGLDAAYGHTWQLTRTWSIDYGVGWGSHVYEGERERRLFGRFGFSGRL